MTQSQDANSSSEDDHEVEDEFEFEVDGDQLWSGSPPGHGESHSSQTVTGDEQASAGGALGPTASSSTSIPLQKRRRVSRACDECRRKKIKCDGKQPCTHCTVYSYECTYNQPSNRRRNPGPHYIEALELKLRRAEKILHTLAPDIDLDDPSVDQAFDRLDSSKPVKSKANASASKNGTSKNESTVNQEDEIEVDSMLESMVETTGSLDLDDEGHWDFYGHSSSRAFLRKMRDQFGDLVGRPSSYIKPFARKSSSDSGQHSSPATSTQSPIRASTPNRTDLPHKHFAKMLCENALDDACAVLRFVHQPSFYSMLDRVYDIPQSELGPEEIKFVPLLYSACALGALFSTGEQSELMTHGIENAIQQGSHWYSLARSMTDVTDCRDLTSLQTTLFMILFLQSTAKLATCYSHLAIALSSAIRLGLHRALPNAFNPIEQETRKRIFWSIRKLDTYVGALLGLPRMLNDDDVDQESPLEIDDKYITRDAILEMPEGHLSFMAAFNAHTRIVDILAKTTKYVYPINQNKTTKGHTYIVSYAKIREIEHDLQQWLEHLPEPFKPGGNTPKEFMRIQHLLRMAYAHIEMFLYRPFLHYVSHDFHSKNVDKRSYACAAACVSVSRNIIHLSGEMKRRGLLDGSYWFYMYTTFFAIISLVFYVLENPRNSKTSRDILKDAYEGKETLAGLGSKSLAAAQTSDYLTDLFNHVSHRLGAAKRAKGAQKKRPQPPNVDVDQNHSTADAPPEQTSTAENALPPSQSVPLPNTAFFAKLQTTDGQIPRRESHDLHTPHIPSNIPSQNPGGAAYIQTPIGHGVTDLSAMMFPSSDPFVYPNQPMTALENGAFQGTGTGTTQLFMNQPQPAPHSQTLPPASYAIPPSQSAATLPPHRQFGLSTDNSINNDNLMGAVDTFPMSYPAAVDQARPNDINVPNAAGPVGEAAQQQGSGPGFDQLFGEDWGGWMSAQGFR